MIKKTYNWTKNKISRAWSWTKRNVKKILIAIGILGVASAATLLAPGETPDPPIIPEPLDIVEMRTVNSKTFQKDADSFIWEGSTAEIHYKEDYNNENEEWKDIDSEYYTDMGDYLLYDRMPIIVKVFKDKVGYEAESRRSGHKVAVELVGEKPLESNIEFQTEITGNKVRLWKILKHENTTKKFKWKVTETNKTTGKYSLNFIDQTEAFDDNDNNADIKNTKTQIDENSFYWEEEFMEEDIYKKQSVPDKIKKVAKERVKVKYPVKIDTDVDEQVGADADDASTLDGTWNLGHYWLSLGYDWSEPDKIGFRFQTVNIPQGSTIDVATLQLECVYSTSSTTVNVILYAEATDDAATFSTEANYDGRGVTSGVNWSSIAAWTAGTLYTSPSIVTPIQAVVDRVGWAANQDMAVLIKDNSSSNGAARFASSYEEDSANAARLHIEWSSAAAPRRIIITE